MYNQKRFVITQQNLIIKNNWIPFYKHKFRLNQIYNIYFEEVTNGDNDSRRLVVKVKEKKHMDIKKFHSKVTARNQQQIAFLVNEQANRSANS